MIGQRHEIASLQSDLYRNRYYKMLRKLFVLAWVMLLLVVVIIYFVLAAAGPPYYGSTTTGRIIPMTPISVTKGNS